MKARLKSTGEIIEVECVFYGKSDRSPLIPSAESEIIQESPWIKTCEKLPTPKIETVDGEEYGSAFVIGRSSKWETPYLCCYFGYNRNYRWENGYVPDYWMSMPEFKE